MELRCIARLVGHTDHVTAISTPSMSNANASHKNVLVSSSRDKSVLIWNFEEGQTGDVLPRHSLLGHSHCVQDIVMSRDGTFALSGSWDRTMRLWDLEARKTMRIFKGHTSDVNSVAFSPSDRQIISGSRDQTIKLWNTLAECKFTFEEKQHTDWVSSVKFSPILSEDSLLCVSCGWDKLVKVWNLKECKLQSDLVGHTQALHSVIVSPDGSLCASGGKDAVAHLWDVHEGKNLYTLEAGASINALSFSGHNYWLCAATDKGVKIWDLEKKQILGEVMESSGGQPIACMSLQWSANGKNLFVGTATGDILVYEYSLQES